MVPVRDAQQVHSKIVSSFPSRNVHFNSETPILIQKRPFYSGNLNWETSGDSKNAFLHWGDILVLQLVCSKICDAIVWDALHAY